MDNNIINKSEIILFRNLFEAVEFAAYKHRFQKRKGFRPVPYINHPISVTKFLLDYLPEAELEMLQAAVLHDTIEDTKTTYEELQNKFGNKVASIVTELTDDMTLTYAMRKRHQVEKASNISYEAGCIKIADKYCNINDILNTRLGWPRPRKIQYILWAIQVIEQVQNKNPKLYKAFNQIIDLAGRVLKKDFKQSS